MRLLVPSVLVAAFTLAGGVEGQASGGVRIYLGSASALPEVELQEDAAFYGLGGIGADWRSSSLEMYATISGGVSLDDRGSDFVSAIGHLGLWNSPPRSSGFGLVAEGYGFRVREPFLHRTGTVRLGPAARVRWGPALVTLRGEGGWGDTRIERRRGDVVRGRTIDLWHYGGSAEISFAGRRTDLVGDVGYWESAEGAFHRVGFSATVGGATLALRGDVALWDTPLGNEWVGGIALVVPFGSRWSVAGTAEQAGPDPLTLVEAGGQGTLLLTLTAVEFGADLALPYELRRDDDTVFASFTLERSGAERVEVVGDFTAWRPVAMERRGSEWEVEIAVPPGTYHYGFRVDGTWYVPEGLPGNVPDEWGQENATLVVPSEKDVGR